MGGRIRNDTNLIKLWLQLFFLLKGLHLSARKFYFGVNRMEWILLMTSISTINIPSNQSNSDISLVFKTIYKV